MHVLFYSQHCLPIYRKTYDIYRYYRGEGWVANQSATCDITIDTEYGSKVRVPKLQEVRVLGSKTICNEYTHTVLSRIIWLNVCVYEAKPFCTQCPNRPRFGWSRPSLTSVSNFSDNFLAINEAVEDGADFLAAGIDEAIYHHAWLGNGKLRVIVVGG